MEEVELLPSSWRSEHDILNKSAVVRYYGGDTIRSQIANYGEAPRVVKQERGKGNSKWVRSCLQLEIT